MEQAMKTCGCGKSYSRRMWELLELIGIQRVAADRFGPEEAYELRNCSCGSTISLELNTRECRAGG
jgi:hypothetical protein